MKMKEVCAATGLTERAVRFYVQEQLVSPQSQRRGGRTWLDFSEADVERLRAIATLRKAGFTVDEIRSMGRDFQNNAPAAAFALRRRLQEAIDAYERLRHIDTAQAEDLKRGKDTRFVIVSKLDDPDATSVQRVQVTGVSFDDLTLADWEAAKIGVIEAPFTADDYTPLET